MGGWGGGKEEGVVRVGEGQGDRGERGLRGRGRYRGEQGRGREDWELEEEGYRDSSESEWERFGGG